MAVFRKMGVAKWMDGLCQGKSHLEIRMMTGGTPMTQETPIWLCLRECGAPQMPFDGETDDKPLDGMGKLPF